MGPVHREGEEPQNIVNFEDEIEEVVKDSVKEMEEDEEYKAFQELEKESYKPKEIPSQPIHETIGHRDILDSVTLLSNHISMLINRNTVELNAESNNENIIIKKLTSIKGDTLGLNAKSFKTKTAENATWFILGISIGFLNEHWMPYVDSHLGSVVKWVVNLFIR